MNNIIMSNTSLPVMCGCDLCAASEAFIHSDRRTDFNVLIYVIEGVIYVTEEDTDFAVTAGSLLFLKKGLRHFGRQRIPKGTRWYFVHFFLDEPNEPEFHADSSALRQYEPLRFQTTLPKRLFELGGSVIEAKLARLVELFHSDLPTKGWELNAQLFSLLSAIAFYGRQLSSAPSLSDRICSYLSDRLAEPFSAAAVEREFFLSYKHLAAVFKREKGVSMQRYHTTLRMNEACRLLRSTLMTVGEISERLGYKDMLYFSRVFNSTVGISPSGYRKNAADYFSGLM